MHVYMVKIALGTKNPAKIKAGELAARELSAELISIDVSSEVSEQPFSDEETIDGAINRARNAMKEADAEFGLGLEGGVVTVSYTHLTLPTMAVV